MIGKLARAGVTGLAVVLTAAAMIPPPVLGQQPKKKEDFHVDVTVSAITIAVTVRDKGGKFINDLEAKDFLVYENNDKRAITYFKHDAEAPVSLAVLLDVSGSMAVQNKLEEAKIGLHKLVTFVLRPKDEIALLIFADGQVEVAAPFSTDRTRFLEELDKVQPFGKTALYDAVAVSPEFANRGRNEKRALLLVTDGVENDSQLPPDKALEIAKRVDVPIFTIGYKIPLDEQLLKQLKRAQNLTGTGIVATLDKFAAATGGKAFFVNDPDAMYTALREIAREQSQQYLIGYTTYKDPNDIYRRIRVLTPHRDTRVRTRQGY